MIPRKQPLALALLLALAGCANKPIGKPPTCDGKSRRPVNIHGSVLGDVPATANTHEHKRAPTPLNLSVAPSDAASTASC